MPTTRISVLLLKQAKWIGGTFDVLNVGNYQGITFESLDYFEAAYAHNNGAAYPNIQDYQ